MTLGKSRMPAANSYLLEGQNIQGQK